jgi:hypothetical protein
MICTVSDICPMAKDNPCGHSIAHLENNSCPEHCGVFTIFTDFEKKHLVLTAKYDKKTPVGIVTRCIPIERSDEYGKEKDD